MRKALDVGTRKVTRCGMVAGRGHFDLGRPLEKRAGLYSYLVVPPEALQLSRNVLWTLVWKTLISLDQQAGGKTNNKLTGGAMRARPMRALPIRAQVGP